MISADGYPSCECTMKGFPLKPEGPMGPWYKKVNDLVAQTRQGDSKARLIELLGPPEVTVSGANSSPQHLQNIMEDVAGGPTLIQYGSKENYDEVLDYKDPFRPRVHYIFGMKGGEVVAKWRDTQAV